MNIPSFLLFISVSAWLTGHAYADDILDKEWAICKRHVTITRCVDGSQASVMCSTEDTSHYLLTDHPLIDFDEEFRTSCDTVLAIIYDENYRNSARIKKLEQERRKPDLDRLNKMLETNSDFHADLTIPRLGSSTRP